MPWFDDPVHGRVYIQPQLGWWTTDTETAERAERETADAAAEAEAVAAKAKATAEAKAKAADQKAEAERKRRLFQDRCVAVSMHFHNRPRQLRAARELVETTDMTTASIIEWVSRHCVDPAPTAYSLSMRAEAPDSLGQAGIKVKGRV